MADAQEAARVAARDLDKWAAEARAGKTQTMGPEGQERMNDSAGSATGTDYRRQDQDTAADRRSVLTEVEKWVAQGRPVPVGVRCCLGMW
ncbi:hypothetical protein OG909_30505 [Streptomyces sp. NBC_01754]|uniref:hypothetical protein n=1 Tax=Streptomyces sp. NBC_01754 TaxID=2975930 RepID=UPI002DDAB5C0|nr:hypothetical protein [Streptomyces sp. NBC_01754]WSC96285.1 hypothetical protein OG909_30505 [Streptomyces sp. NBC_01754]